MDSRFQFGFVLKHLESIWPEGIPKGYALPCVALITNAEKKKTAPKHVAVSFETELAVAAHWLTEMGAKGWDTYVQSGVVTVERAEQLKASGGRGAARDVMIVPSFYVDFDVDPSAGKFKSTAKVIEFIGKLPMPPTLLVDSGHGVHGHWVFTEPFEIRPLFDQFDRDRIASYIHGFSLHIRNEAVSLAGARMDSVGELARIGRVPGTMNYKHDPPVQTSRIGDAGQAINVSDLEIYECAPTHNTVGENSVLTKLGSFSVNPDPHIKYSRLNVLLSNLEEYKAVWEHKSKRQKDPSLSGWDMTIAHMAAQAGWSPQEVCDLIVHHRQIHRNMASNASDPLKLKNTGYYQKTIAKAFGDLHELTTKESAKKAADGAAEAVAAINIGAINPQSDAAKDARDIVLNYFRTVMDLTLVRVERMGRESKAAFAVHFNEIGDLEFDSLKEIGSWSEWRHQLALHNRVLDAKAPTQWWSIFTRMNHLFTTENETASDHDLVQLELLSKYTKAGDANKFDGAAIDGISSSVVTRRCAALSGQGYFREIDGLIVDPSTFYKQFGQQSHMKQLNSYALFKRALKQIGGRSRQVRIASVGEETHQQVYHLPISVLKSAQGGRATEETADEQIPTPERATAVEAQGALALDREPGSDDDR